MEKLPRDKNDNYQISDMTDRSRWNTEKKSVVAVEQCDRHIWISGIVTHLKKAQLMCEIIFFLERLSQWLFAAEISDIFIQRWRLSTLHIGPQQTPEDVMRDETQELGVLGEHTALSAL